MVREINIRFEKPKPKKGFIGVDMHTHANYSHSFQKMRNMVKKAEKKKFGFALTDYASAEKIYSFRFAPYQRIIFLTIDSIQIICSELEIPITQKMLHDSMEPEFEEVYMMINQFKKGS